MSQIIIDLLIVLVVLILVNILFNNFEKHLSYKRRILKHGVLFIVIALIRMLIGQVFFLIILGLLSLGPVILHAWWFPKNGVNGLTAKPYEKYLTLIKQMKSNGRRKIKNWLLNKDSSGRNDRR